MDPTVVHAPRMTKETLPEKWQRGNTIVDRMIIA
jgi:hypothetical protein